MGSRWRFARHVVFSLLASQRHRIRPLKSHICISCQRASYVCVKQGIYFHKPIPKNLYARSRLLVLLNHPWPDWIFPETFPSSCRHWSSHCHAGRISLVVEQVRPSYFHMLLLYRERRHDTQARTRPTGRREAHVNTREILHFANRDD